MNEEKLNIFESNLRQTAQTYEAKSISQRKNLKFSEKRRKLAERKKRTKAIKQNSKVNHPSQEQLYNLLELYKNGRFNDAEKLAAHITRAFPNSNLHGKF